MEVSKPKNTYATVTDLHFWIILGIILVLSVFYYLDIMYFAETRSWGLLRSLEIFEFKYDLHGILFCIPFLYSVVVYWWRGALITWLISLAIIFPKILFFSPDIESLITNIFYLAVPLLVIIFISTELRWREKERRGLAERENERQSFISQIFRAQEHERQRLARELHDGPTQLLLVMAAHADKLNSAYEVDKPAQESRKYVKWIKEISISISEELRRLSLDLRPNILDNLGLVPALRWLVASLKPDGISGEITIKGEARKLSSEVDINLFRIVQEALNNIRRHSQATQVVVELMFNLDTVKVIIQDNGSGFNYPTTGELTSAGKLGLLGMQQRIQSLNGTINFQSEIGFGTTITFEIKA